MSENMNEHRKFVHDFANQLTIADGGLYRVMNLLKEKNQTETDEYIRLAKVSEAVKNSIKMLKDYRQYIHSQIKDVNHNP